VRAHTHTHTLPWIRFVAGCGFCLVVSFVCRSLCPFHRTNKHKKGVSRSVGRSVGGGGGGGCEPTVCSVECCGQKLAAGVVFRKCSILRIFVANRGWTASLSSSSSSPRAIQFNRMLIDSKFERIFLLNTSESNFFSALFVLFSLLHSRYCYKHYTLPLRQTNEQKNRNRNRKSKSSVRS